MSKEYREYFIDDLHIYVSETGEHSVAQNQVWLPGLYDSINACILAADRSDEELIALWEKFNPILPSDTIHYLSEKDLKTITE